MRGAFNKNVCKLFTKGSHHRNLLVILVTQDIFQKTSHSRDISLNTKYIVAFKNPSDKLQFQCLARQIYPENPTELFRIYKEVTEPPHGYLLIDLTQGINDLLIFRCDIFNSEYSVCYSNESGLQKDPKSLESKQTFIVCAHKG